MTVDDIGPSLRRAVAKVTKATREHAPANGTGRGRRRRPVEHPRGRARAGSGRCRRGLGRRAAVLTED